MSGTRVLVPGPKILLMGNPGDGKTDSIRTLVAAGLKVFVQFTEPGQEVLLDKRRRVYTCEEGLHWNYVPPVAPEWGDLVAAGELLNKFSFKQLSEMPPTNREKFRGWIDFLSSMANLKCQRCNKSFGPADQLQPYNEWALVNDSLSSISLMALNVLIGTKPAVHQGEWGIAMGNLERYINKFCYDIPSMAVMMCHAERESEEVSGGVINMAATLGRKLAPKIPRAFSDVLMATREGSKFTWSNITSNYLLKSRNFPFASGMAPDFGPAVTAWREKIKSEEAAQVKEAASAQALSDTQTPAAVAPR